jgi:hypothetical protein
MGESRLPQREVLRSLSCSRQVTILAYGDQKAVLPWDRDPSIVNVVFKPLGQIRNETVSHFLRERAEPPCERHRVGPAREELAHVVIARCPVLKA